MNKEFLKKCWKNPRWHSLMVLILWIVSLTLLMGIVSILNMFSSPKELINRETNQKSSAMSYEEKWEHFVSDNYTYTYTITKNEETIKYEGTVKEGIDSGYRERKDGIIRYSIENGIVYEILVNEKNEIQTLYENVEANFLHPTSIYEIIKNIEVNDIDILEENKKNGKKKLNDLEIHIKTALKELTEKDDTIKEMEKDPLIIAYNNRLSERQQQKESILESYKKLEKKRKECGHSLQYLLDYQHGREESKDQLVCKCVECKRVRTYIYGEERIRKDALNFLYLYEDDKNDLSFGGACIFIPRVGKIDIGPSYEELRKEFFELLEEEKISFNCTTALYDKYMITNDKEINDEMIIRSLQKNCGE